MRRIPCRVCNKCGLYNDISVNICECGAVLSGLPARLVDEDIPPEKYGDINEHLQVYVQKCSACGAESYTIDPNIPAKICYNCHKTRIASVAPVLFVDEESHDNKGSYESNYEKSKDNGITDSSNQELTLAEDDNDEEDESALWDNLLGNVQSVSSTIQLQKEEFSENEGKDVNSDNRYPSANSCSDEDDEDDEDDDNVWGALVSGVEPIPRRVNSETEITLTAIRYGKLSFTIKSSQKSLPILLGRSAQLRDFLAQDLRVGNEHCFIDFQSGQWYVVDNHSANGTAVNRQFLEINGKHMLRDGDELTLGHHPDSIAFRISIR